MQTSIPFTRTGKKSSIALVRKDENSSAQFRFCVTAIPPGDGYYSNDASSDHFSETEAEERGTDLPFTCLIIEVCNRASLLANRTTTTKNRSSFSILRIKIFFSDRWSIPESDRPVDQWLATEWLIINVASRTIPIWRTWHMNSAFNPYS